MDVDAILTEAMEEAVAQIRDNLETTRTNASGKTSASLEIENYEGGVRLLGRSNFQSVEQGSPSGERKGFYSIIRQWIDDKIARGWFSLRLVPYKREGRHKKSVQERSKDIAARAIAGSIQRKGTQLYRDGGRANIYTDVLTEAVENLQSRLAEVAAVEVKEDILTKLNTK